MTESAPLPDPNTGDVSAIMQARAAGQIDNWTWPRYSEALQTRLRTQSSAEAEHGQTFSPGGSAEVPADASVTRHGFPVRTADPTPNERARTEQLEREAYTTPAALPTDFVVPGHAQASEEVRAANDDLTAAMHAGGLPTAVGNMILNRGHELAARFDSMSGAERDQHSEFAAAEMRRSWGSEFQSRITTIKDYAKQAAEKAAQAGRPQLKDILTYAPELLDDPQTLETLWRAASHWKAARG